MAARGDGDWSGAQRGGLLDRRRGHAIDRQPDPAEAPARTDCVRADQCPLIACPLADTQRNLPVPLGADLISVLDEQARLALAAI